ncbi:DUF4132 domain-containing protein [Flexivirga oryzae]|uniref:DUF4132 domain-containing protein n=1 Tax=Flexivirga oryzae TaxID=1794944 RepID=A0A839NGJ4_9MICO|nr:DUF4132 domain-containing protein [Flexivirga oryzae]MBB2894255.1 hypothetical protein [Flexivirga oryzae]
MTMDPSTGPGGLRAALGALVEPLAEVHPWLPAALIDFVLHSGSDAVLMLLEPPRTGSFESEEQRRQDRLLHARIGGYGTGSVEADRRAQRGFYQELGASTPAIQLRWYRVLAALHPQTTDDPLPLSALLHGYANAVTDGPSFGHPQLERLLEFAGHPPVAVLGRAFAASTEDELYGVRDLLTAMPGYADALTRHHDTVVESMRNAAGRGRLAVLGLLERQPLAVLRQYLQVLAEYAVSGSSEVRAAAQKLLAEAPATEVDDAFWRLAADGRPNERAHALRRLYERASDPDARERVLLAARSDRAASVRQVADDLPIETAPVQLPSAPTTSVDWQVSQSPELNLALRQLRDDLDLAAAEMSLTAPRGRAPGPDDPGVLGNDGLLDLTAAVLGTGTGADRSRVKWRWLASTTSFERFAQSDGVQLPALLRALQWFGLLRIEGSLSEYTVLGIHALHDARPEPPSFDDVARALTDLGVPRAAVVEAVCFQTLGAPWDRADLAGFVARHLPTILSLTEETHDRSALGDTEVEQRAAATELLGALDDPPERVVRQLGTAAVTGPQQIQRAARAALGDGPHAVAAVGNAIGHGRATVRTAGARWAAERHLSAAVPALERAVRAERSDTVRAAQLDALEALGRSVSEYVDRDALVGKARESAAEPLPDTLAWFPWPELPVVRWADSGAPVPPEVIRAHLVQSVRSKDPQPDVLLRRYCALYDPADRERLGDFVARSWIDADLAEVRRLERENEPILDPRIGSLIAAKGALAVAAACAGGGVTPLVQSYLNEWYGMRAAQCKALLTMLAWVDDPSAVNLLLAVGRKFRTPSIRKEAAALIEGMAERHGWTPDEFADRTIPEDVTGRKLKSVQREQTARLYEAMVSERLWSVPDWRRFTSHPVIAPLVSGLVWRAAPSDGAQPVVFTVGPDGRPLAVTGSVTELPPDTVVGLAHGSRLPAAEVEGWTAWLGARDAAPVLSQFGRAAYVVPDGQRRSTEIADFTGCLLTGFTLRNRAKKLGYQRGPTLEGGWFVRYEKTFVSTAVTVAIYFSGNVLPEDDLRIALTDIRFERSRPGRPARFLRLEKVPPVLVTEAYHDAADIAGRKNVPVADWRDRIRRS